MIKIKALHKTQCIQTSCRWQNRLPSYPSILFIKWRLEEIKGDNRCLLMLQCRQQLSHVSPGGPRRPRGHEEGGQCRKPCPGRVCCHGRQRGHRKHRWGLPVHLPRIHLLPSSTPLVPLVFPPSSHHFFSVASCLSFPLKIPYPPRNP